MWNDILEKTLILWTAFKMTIETGGTCPSPRSHGGVGINTTLVFNSFFFFLTNEHPEVAPEKGTLVINQSINIYWLLPLWWVNHEWDEHDPCPSVAYSPKEKKEFENTG